MLAWASPGRGGVGPLSPGERGRRGGRRATGGDPHPHRATHGAFPLWGRFDFCPALSFTTWPALHFGFPPASLAHTFPFSQNPVASFPKGPPSAMTPLRCLLFPASCRDLLPPTGILELWALWWPVASCAGPGAPVSKVASGVPALGM